MVRAYRPGTAISYRLRNAASRFAEETRRRTTPGLTRSEGKDAFNWARSSYRSEGATGCGDDGCLADLTPEIACEPLPAAGLTCSPDEIQIGARDERWGGADIGAKRRSSRGRWARLMAKLGSAAYRGPWSLINCDRAKVRSGFAFPA